MASNGSFNTSSYINRSLEFSWSLQSQSVADNTSTITWALKGSGSAAGYVKCGAFRVVIDGAVVYDKPTDYRVDVYSGTAIASGTKTIKHNANGTRSFSASVQGAVYFYDVNVYGSASWSLNVIPRQAVILTAPNFTDIDNPTITYRNDAGTALTSLQACISLTGADDIKYRDIPMNGSSYTFELTDAERNVLRAQTINTKTATATFYITSVIGGQTYYSTIKRILTITDDEPGLSVSLTDSNSTTAALTGNTNNFIRYYSKPSFVMTASPQKGSSIKSYKAVNGGQVVSAASGSFDGITSNTFEFSVVDSRGNTTTQKITRTLVDYIKLTCHLNLEAPDIDGNLKFTIGGNYFMGSFGATSNNLSVQYRYKVNDGDYGDWIDAGIVADGHVYQSTVSMTELNYQNKYTFQARAVDKVATVLSAEYAVKTKPLFDWGESDFNFNVPITIEGRQYGTNKILWSGASHMNGNQIQTLTEAISAQPHGIVLVFSGYDNAASAAKDSSINTFFISKEQVNLFPNCGHTFILGINAGFSGMAAKYLYFTDTTIKGHEGNTSSGTNSGITFNNSNYVLRYVIGV